MAAIPNIPKPVHKIRDEKLEAIHIELKDAQAHRPNHYHDVMYQLQPSLELHNQPIENFRPIKVIVIGAGYSGVYCGIRIPEKIRNCELLIYEKNAGVGGAWYENRYPGCACDVPSHSYQYSFNPNPNWSSLYAPAAEIRKYIEDTARKFSVHRFVKLQHAVEGCRFDQQQGKWHVKIRKPNGDVFEDTSDVLISARGNLNHIAWPEVDGLKNFAGELMHSAAWNESYDFTNKRVGIIGCGSSAIQIIPNLRKTPGAHLDCFIRGRTWISPPFAQNVQDDLGMTSFNFSDEQRQRFREDPDHFLQFRRKIEIDGNAAHHVTVLGTEMQKAATTHFEESMKQRLSKRPDIFDKIKPSFAPGCRRLTPGPGFLEALVEDNVSFINTSIQRIESKGIVTSDGQLHEIDALVCATGFHVSSAPPFPVTGMSSLPLSGHWSSRATTYLSLCTDSFPNMFIMLGPNAAIGSGSLTLMIEHTGDYIVKCIRKLQKENIRSMAVKPARVRDFSAYCDAYFPTTVFSDQCRSWYRTGDKITGLWPGSTLHCIEALRSPRWEDYEYEYHEEGGNQLAFLGNGWSSLQLEEGADMAWYLRPEYQDMPREGRPEDREEYRTRAFSY